MKTIRKINIYLTQFLLLTLLSCDAQKKEKYIPKELKCGNYFGVIKLPKIKKEYPYEYTEGKVVSYITKDDVIIEFYCGGMYSSHVSNDSIYKVLFRKEDSSFGFHLKNKLFWRKKGRLAYSNCKAKDTAKYNKIFDDFELKKVSVKN